MRTQRAEAKLRFFSKGRLRYVALNCSELLLGYRVEFLAMCCLNSHFIGRALNDSLH